MKIVLIRLCYFLAIFCFTTSVVHATHRPKSQEKAIESLLKNFDQDLVEKCQKILQEKGYERTIAWLDSLLNEGSNSINSDSIKSLLGFFRNADIRAQMLTTLEDNSPTFTKLALNLRFSEIFAETLDEILNNFIKGLPPEIKATPEIDRILKAQKEFDVMRKKADYSRESIVAKIESDFAKQFYAFCLKKIIAKKELELESDFAKQFFASCLKKIIAKKKIELSELTRVNMLCDCQQAHFPKTNDLGRTIVENIEKIIKNHCKKFLINIEVPDVEFHREFYEDQILKNNIIQKACFKALGPIVNDRIKIAQLVVEILSISDTLGSEQLPDIQQLFLLTGQFLKKYSFDKLSGAKVKVNKLKKLADVGTNDAATQKKLRIKYGVSPEGYSVRGKIRSFRNQSLLNAQSGSADSERKDSGSDTKENLSSPSKDADSALSPTSSGNSISLSHSPERKRPLTKKRSKSFNDKRNSVLFPNNSPAMDSIKRANTYSPELEIPKIPLEKIRENKRLDIGSSPKKVQRTTSSRRDARVRRTVDGLSATIENGSSIQPLKKEPVRIRRHYKLDSQSCED